MPNPIKYSASAQTLALKKGNFWIGTGDVGKGPTSTTSYYNGITPPSGGYTIYLNKASGGPSIYTAANDSALISLSNTISGQTFATAAAALAWFDTQSDKMVFNRDYEGIVTDSLAFNLDAGFSPSYSKIGTSWYDVSPNSLTNNLLNGPSYSSGNGGYISFDGVDDKGQGPISSSIDFTNTDAFSLESFCYASARSGSGMIPIIERYYWSTSGKGGYGMRLAQYGHTRLSFYVTGTPVGMGVQDSGVESVTTWQPNTWYHMVGTRSAGGIQKIYVNGVLENTVQGLTSIPLTSDDYPLMIAARGDTRDQYAASRIAVARIYRKELSASEVLQNFNAQKGRFGL
jgi:hypothetical protein